MRTFYKLLGVALLVVTTNNFVWFALTFWAYLSTKSVISTSTLAGVFLVMTMVSGLWFGSLVDHHKKKHAMLGSSIVTLLLFIGGLALLHFTPADAFASVRSVPLWIFAVVLLAGTIVGSIYNIAIPTLVAFIVPEDRRDRANGMFGTVIGLAFGITSVASGLVLAFGGMKVVLVIAIVATVLAIAVLALIPVHEERPAHTAGEPAPKKELELRGTIQAVRNIPGLFPLIFFTTFNNFLGGVFFALMDAYGLSMVSVKTWGTLWGIVSLGMILGGLYISRHGLGGNPLRALFRVNFIMWTVSIFFTIQPSMLLLAVGVFIWLFLIPFVEAVEQTIFQKVVPPERLGRVFGFAHSIEQSASPVTAFFIGPIAQWLFVPFMTTGRGVELIGSWFGTGVARGLALVFITAGLLGLLVTALVRRSKSYRVLAERTALNIDRA
ncbi:MAG TPA: MFS transporter [Thermoanaerobaculia bacterium]|nr:MFS transporter [Thermoanaerobaculia bacterium]